jgi:hypothetical protein
MCCPIDFIKPGMCLNSLDGTQSFGGIYLKQCATECLCTAIKISKHALWQGERARSNLCGCESETVREGQLTRY